MEIYCIAGQDRTGRQDGACTLHGGYLRLRHSELVLLIAFTLQQWVQGRYTYIVCFVSNREYNLQFHNTTIRVLFN